MVHELNNIINVTNEDCLIGCDYDIDTNDNHIYNTVGHKILYDIRMSHNNSNVISNDVNIKDLSKLSSKDVYECMSVDIPYKKN